MPNIFEKDYLLNKPYKLGQKTLRTPFKELAEWIAKEYGVKIININIPKQKFSTPRLTVTLDSRYDANKLLQSGSDDRSEEIKMLVAKKFVQLSNETKGFLQKLYDNLIGQPYNSATLNVRITTFDFSARIESVNAISDADVAAFIREFGPNEIWTISRRHMSSTLFLNTDQQLQECVDSKKTLLTDKYFELVKRYDPFNYIERGNFSILFDSKENFDKKFGGSWEKYHAPDDAD